MALPKGVHTMNDLGIAVGGMAAQLPSR